jgi:hypothetical protein
VNQARALFIIECAVPQLFEDSSMPRHLVGILDDLIGRAGLAIQDGVTLIVVVAPKIK